MKNNFIPIARPYFTKTEINTVLTKYKKILMGEGLMSMGQNVEKFEKLFSKIQKTKFSIATSSCTSALEISLHSLNLKDGDEVIIPCQTFIATASSILRNRLKPVICEIDENFQLNFEDLKKKISKKTKAVIIVHYSGYISENIFKIVKYLRRKKIKLIEDCAHSLGSSRNGVNAGNFGDISCFSFYSTKNLTTGEGGMIICKNKKIFEKIRSYRSRGLNYKGKIEEYSYLGTNSRMTEFQAILGIEQLKRIHLITKARNQIARNYNKLLFKNNNNIKIKNFYKDTINDNFKNCYWKFLVKLNYNLNRLKIKDLMKKRNIAIDWAYYPLIHKQKIIKKVLGNQSLKNSEKFVKNFFCLPMYIGLTYDQQKYICNSLLKIINEK